MQKKQTRKIHISEHLARNIGDTHIDSKLLAPQYQWELIVKLLNAKGYRIIRVNPNGRERYHG